ncbi:PREDICTED: CLAVATA3/ESR (CLE)-related protein 25-like isoform X1 [Lupinus angustifolius]|uniref:CLAVATA3/ESR (CLE)-related protein 25-like isoform X1 n=1 Tax=Lupinus angustifolius TaxID=3871 RepID=UPI00092F3FA0|nr:PREDICTED: CLAVATA3/ESR (CLE)-related protein 25-like isoform X1 [Lupinus angustifolius]
MGVVVVVGVRSRIRFVLGALIFVGVIWFMFLAISMDLHQTKRTMVLVPLHVMSKHLKLVSMERHSLHSNSGLIFVSKRKVPNGPDPIHNRRAVKFRQPPTQA